MRRLRILGRLSLPRWNLSGTAPLHFKRPDWRVARWLVALLAVGLLLLAVRPPTAGGGGPSTSPAAGRPGGRAPAPAATRRDAPQAKAAAAAFPATVADPVAAQEAQMDRYLEAILSRVAGAGQVHVAVSVDGGERTAFASDKTTTSQTGGPSGGTGTTQQSEQDTVVMAQSGSASGQSPVTAQVLRPAVQGVLVVATGATSPEVRAELVQAAAAAAGVSFYRVVVLPGQATRSRLPRVTSGPSRDAGGQGS